MPEPEGSIAEDRYHFEITASEVRRFADAGWDENPVYRRGDESGRVHVPPVFGCLAATLAGRPHSVETLGFDIARAFHGEETIFLSRPLEVGTTLMVRDDTRLLTPVRGRRGGTMRRARRRSVLSDGSGELVGVATRTFLETEDVLVGSTPSGDVSVFDDGLRLRPDPTPPNPVATAGLSTGDRFPAMTFGPLTRTDFVRYAVASADLTAIHFDELAARSRGYATVFGMGMLSAAFVSHALTDWLVLTYPLMLTVRFADQIWPGDQVAVAGEVRAAGSDAIEVALSCTSARGELATASVVFWRPGTPIPGIDDPETSRQ
jgi:acyl dehydratase